MCAVEGRPRDDEVKPKAAQGRSTEQVAFRGCDRPAKNDDLSVEGDVNYRGHDDESRRWPHEFCQSYPRIRPRCPFVPNFDPSPSQWEELSGELDYANLL